MMRSGAAHTWAREAGTPKLGQQEIGALVIPPVMCPSTSTCRVKPCTRSPWMTSKSWTGIQWITAREYKSQCNPDTPVRPVTQ